MNLIFFPLYVIYRSYSGARHWVRRRFTKAGLVILLSWIVTGMMGFDTDNSVAYQGFTVLASLLLVGLIFMPLFRGRFSVSRDLPRFGTVGQPFTYQVTVTNLTAKPQAGLTLLENLTDTRPHFADWKALQLDDEKHVRHFRFANRRRFNPFKFAEAGETPLAAMAPGRSAAGELALTPLRRGVIQNW